MNSEGITIQHRLERIETHRGKNKRSEQRRSKLVQKFVKNVYTCLVFLRLKDARKIAIFKRLIYTTTRVILSQIALIHR